MQILHHSNSIYESTQKVHPNKHTLMCEHIWEAKENRQKQKEKNFIKIAGANLNPIPWITYIHTNTHTHPRTRQWSEWSVTLQRYRRWRHGNLKQLNENQGSNSDDAKQNLFHTRLDFVSNGVFFYFWVGLPQSSLNPSSFCVLPLVAFYVPFWPPPPKTNKYTWLHCRGSNKNGKL